MKTLSDSAYLLDSNVWVALAFSSHPFHAHARDAFSRATQACPAIFCRATQLSFLRLSTTTVLIEKYGAVGFTNLQAVEVLAKLQAHPSVVYREEPAGVEPIWHKLAAKPVASHRLWMDAYLAAFAIAGGSTIVSLDKGFRVFEAAGLRLELLFQESSP